MSDAVSVVCVPIIPYMSGEENKMRVASSHLLPFSEIQATILLILTYIVFLAPWGIHPEDFILKERSKPALSVANRVRGY